MYTSYSDSQHGWLRVSAKELMDLDLLSKISCHSRMSFSGRWVYLEQDCDLTTYLAATNKPQDWCALNVKNINSTYSAIRRYPRVDRDFILYQASKTK